MKGTSFAHNTEHLSTGQKGLSIKVFLRIVFFTRSVSLEFFSFQFMHMD